MKSILKKLSLALLFLSALPVFAETPAFTISPPVVSNTYNGTITLQITGLSPGESVVVQKYLDVNSNGVIDAGDFLVQQFNLTDGQASVFSGVTNRNVPGDTDIVAGQITSVLNFANGAIGQAIVARYGCVISSPSNNFSAVTNFFTVTNASYAQSFSGTVMNSGTNVPGTVVLLFQPAGNDLNLIASALTDGVGHYAINAPVGTYIVAPTRSGYVTDLSVAPNLSLASGASTVANLTLDNPTLTISGSLVDANNSAIPLPGVFGSMQSTNNLLTIFFADANGNFVAAVTGTNQWKIDVDEASLASHGYLKPQNKPKVNINSSSVSGVIFSAPRATALFYGTVTNGSGNPLVGVPINGFDMNGQYNADATTDQNGNYYLGVVGGLGSDTWSDQVNNGNGSPFANYIFSTSSIGQNGGTNLNTGVSVLQNFTGLPAPYQITGIVTSNGVSAISGVGVSADATINGVNFNSYADTDAGGNYSLPVASGAWNVSVNCNAGSDSLDSISSAYTCPQNQSVNITTSSGSASFIAHTYSTFISGRVLDDTGAPVTSMNVFAFITNGGGFYQATTDSSGNFLMGIVGGSYTLGLNNDPNSGFPSRNLVGPSVPVTVTDGVNINNFILVAPQVHGAIQVQVNNSGSMGVSNIEVTATLTIGNTNYVTYGGQVPTGASGFVSLPVFNGTWSVSLDNIQNQGYAFVASQNVTIANNTQPVTFTVTPVAGPSLSLPSLHAGQFQFRLTGYQGQNYSVQFSTNLSHWSLLFVTNNSQTNSFILTESASGGSQGYYRILVGP
jgi:hypothetical protein